MEKLFKPLLIISMMCTSSMTFAKGAGETENIDMYAPKSGGHEIIFGVTLIDIKTDSDPAGTETKTTGNIINLGYAYGLSEKISLFVTQNMYNAKLEAGAADFDYKGLSLTTLGIKGIVAFNDPYLYYDLSYSSSLLAKRKLETSESNIYLNTDDRNHINGTIGYAYPFGMFSIAAQYAYYMFQDTSYDVNNVDTKFGDGNGNTWKIYLQLDYTAKFGLAYGEEMIDAHDTEVAGVTFSDAVVKTEVKQMQLYSIIPVSSMGDLLIDIKKYNLKDEDAFSKYNNYAASIGFRLIL